MLESLLILILGIIPALLSVLMMRRAEAQARERLQTAIQTAANRNLRHLRHLSSEHRYVEGMGYLVGDITCRFNARSAYLRCAVNPSGPCKNCSCYESIDWCDSGSSLNRQPHF
jgi:hypothetical protein